jgi:hypothetical protein
MVQWCVCVCVCVCGGEYGHTEVSCYCFGGLYHLVELVLEVVGGQTVNRCGVVEEKPKQSLQPQPARSEHERSNDTSHRVKKWLGYLSNRTSLAQLATGEPWCGVPMVVTLLTLHNRKR